MTDPTRLIDVAVALPVKGSFTYRIPEALGSMAETGKRVLVPFGNRRVTGYVLSAAASADRMTIKQILDVLDDTPLFPAAMIPFFRWIADYYHHPLGEVIRSALPAGLTSSDYATIAITPAGREAIGNAALTAMEHAILAHLAQTRARHRDLVRHLGTTIPVAVLRNLERCGWVLWQRQLKGGHTGPVTRRYVSLVRADVSRDRFYEPRRKVLDALASWGDMPLYQLKARLPEAKGCIPYLIREGFVRQFEQTIYRDPFGESIVPDRPKALTPAQAQVVASVFKTLGQGFQTHLLAGVTGSGKTEIYMHLAAAAVEKKRSVLVLVPEIALISQIERRFRARFGQCVAVLHSGLSAGQRYDQWLRVLRKETPIVIGARSAIFAPLDRPGLIIVDEEHDASYKQETGLRYNARDLAIVRGKAIQATVLLGSATPSVQSYHNVTTGKFSLLTLQERIQRRPMARVTVVDLSAGAARRGHDRLLTPQLRRAMDETLARGEQVLLFLNRRGFATFPVCGQCGEAIRCRNCDITLTLHQASNAYRCHYCGFSMAASAACPTCGSHHINRLGMGTEKVQTAVKALFPEARVARLDRDTTVRKGALVKILKEMHQGRIDVLIGTQMVAKGHDFPGITLVGIICADLSLSFPDFRSGERTFQVLAQVAGRAGRGDMPGKVILQTYTPEHFCITAAREQDFAAFYHQEIRFRKALGYPPFSRMIQLKISGADEKKTAQTAERIGQACQKIRQDAPPLSETVTVLGPIQAPLARIARRYRWQLLLKGTDAGLLHRFVARLQDVLSLAKPRSVRVDVDVDPYSML